MKIITVLLVFLLFPGFWSCGNVIAGNDIISDIKFRILTTKEGLSSNSIQSYLMDSYGFMWIGTQAGLTGIGERVKMLKGTMEIKSGKG